MAMVRAHGKRFNHQHPDFSDRHIVHSAAQQDGRMIVRISELFVLTASPSRPIGSRYRFALSNAPDCLTRPARPSEGPRAAARIIVRIMRRPQIVTRESFGPT
jgi:hypothetical protein